jgi:hypothetical protein
MITLVGSFASSLEYFQMQFINLRSTSKEAPRKFTTIVGLVYTYEKCSRSGTLLLTGLSSCQNYKIFSYESGTLLAYYE